MPGVTGISSPVGPGTHTQVLLTAEPSAYTSPERGRHRGKNAEMAGVLVWCKFCLLQAGTWAPPGSPSHGLEHEASSNSRVLEQSGASCQFGREGLSTPSYPEKL